MLLYKAGYFSNEVHILNGKDRMSVGLPDVLIEVYCGVCQSPKGKTRIFHDDSVFHSLHTLCTCYFPFVRQYVTSYTAF
jgi:hypothetical protein